MKRLGIILISIFTLASLIACGTTNSGKSSDSNAKKTVKVGILKSAPPFEYKDNGKLVGYEVDILHKIAQDNNWTIKNKYMDFDAMIPALQSGSIDAAFAGIYITDKRKKAISFSHPFYKNGNQLAVPPDSSIKHLDDLKHKKIAAKQGAASEDPAKKLARQYNGETKLFKDDSEMFLSLKNKSADAIVTDSAIIAYKEKQSSKDRLRKVKLLDQDPVGAALQKNSDIRSDFNKSLTKYKNNGYVKKLKKKYDMA